MIGLKKVVFGVLAGLAVVVTLSTGFAKHEATIIPDTNGTVATIIPDTNVQVATIIPDTNVQVATIIPDTNVTVATIIPDTNTVSPVVAIG